MEQKRTKPKTSWLRRVVTWLALGVLSLVVLLALAYGLRNEVVAPLALSWIEDRVERETGLLLSIDEVGGDWIHDLRLSGVTVHAREPGPGLTFASIGETEVEFDVRRVLRGDLGGVGRVDLREVVVRVDLASPPRAPAARGGGSGAFELPAMLPSGSITGLDLELLLPGGRRFAVERTGLTVEHLAEADRLELDAVRTVVDLWPGWPARVERVRGTFDYDAGVLDIRDLGAEGDRVLDISGSRLDLRGVGRGHLAWNASIAGFGGELRSRGALDDAGLALSVETRALELGEVWDTIAPRFADIPRATVDVTGELSVVRGELRATASVSARDACVLGRAFDLIDGDFLYEPSTLRVARIDVAQGPNAFRGRELSIPFDRDDWLEQLRAARGSVELEVTDFGALTRAPTAGVPAHRLDFVGELDERGLELTRGELLTEGGELRVRRGRVEWSEAREGFVEGLRLDVDASADFHDLAPLARVFARERWSGSAHGALRISGTLAHPDGRLDVVAEDVVAEGMEIGDLHALARADSERVHVESLAADGRYGHLELGGDFALPSRTIEHARLSLSSDRLEELLPREFEAGSFALEAEFAGALDAPLGTFALSASNVVPRCQPSVPSLAALGRFSGGTLELDELSVAIERAQARTSGRVRYRETPPRVELDSAVVEREGLDLALSAPIAFAADPNAIDLRDVTLAGSAGRIVAAVAWRGGRLDVSANCDELNPMPLIAPFAPEGFELARTHGAFELALGPDLFDFAADFGLEGLRFAAQAPLCSLRCRAAYTAGSARIDTLVLRSTDGGFASFTGTLPLDAFAEQPLVDGELSLRGSVSLPALEALPWRAVSATRSASGALSGEVDLGGSWHALRGTLAFTGKSVRLITTDDRRQVAEAGFAPADFELRAALADTLDVERFSIDVPGILRVEALARAEIAGDFLALLEHDLGATPVEAHATFAAEDLSFVAGLAPRWLRRTAGALSGDLELHGSLDAPQVLGTLRLERGELRTQTALPTIDRLNAVVRFDGLRATIEALTGEIGAGTLSASGSVALGSDEPEFDVQLTGGDILLVQRQDVRARANAKLAVTGPWSRLHVAGKVDLTDGRFEERIEWIDKSGRPRSPVDTHEPWFTLANTPFANATFDVAIGCTRPFRVDVKVPGVASARAALKPALTLRGRGDAPEIVGPVYLDSARVSLTGSSLELGIGTVTLDDLEPRAPLLDLVFGTRVAGYDVTLQINGRANDFNREARSDPALSEEAIYQLLLSGQVPVDGSLSETSLDTAQAVAVYIGQDLVSNWFETEEDGTGESFFDRIEWQRGADVTKGGGSTFQGRLRIAGPMRGPGKIMYLRGERDLYDRINFGLRFLLRVE